MFIVLRNKELSKHSTEVMSLVIFLAKDLQQGPLLEVLERHCSNRQEVKPCGFLSGPATEVALSFPREWLGVDPCCFSFSIVYV